MARKAETAEAIPNLAPLMPLWHPDTVCARCGLPLGDDNGNAPAMTADRPYDAGDREAKVQGFKYRRIAQLVHGRCAD